MSEWEEESRRRFPAASDKARGELRDHLPQLLESLCDVLGGDASDACRLSRIHGRQRFAIGDFNLAQILGEYRLLKDIVVRHDEASAESRLPRLLRITKFFDEASSTAAIEFVELREHELRETGARLTVANDELTRFSGVVAHDLRSPLATVSSYAEMLAEENLGPSARESLRIIRATVGRTIRLIDRLLAYTRAGHEASSHEPVDLNEVWTSARGNLAREIAAADARVTADGLGRACGDSVLLEQLLQNLVANSLKFRKPDARCEINIERTATTGREAEFMVRDNGVGFDPAKNERIFQPFERAHRSDEYPGCGLGLATCQRVVEAHGGRIWARGEVGRGAEFHFTLPIECAE